ncbi:MAG: ATP-dependent DNA helicase [Thermoplasmata archaeon]
MKIFPYRFRENQREMYDFIEDNAGDYPLCIQAPTGFGKTPVTLSALLEKGGKILWVVRTGTETDRPVEELKKIDENGGDFIGISFRGKRDMCLLVREKITESSISYEDVSFFCERNMKNCIYKKNLDDFNTIPDRPMLYSELLELSRRERICPYYYQRKIAPYMDVISINYNYIINENMLWSLRRILDPKETYLVIDEAHNLQFIAMNLNSDSISTNSISRAFDELNILGNSPGLYDTLRKLQIMLSSLISRKKEMRLEFERILDEIDDPQIENLIKAGTRIRSNRMKEGKRPFSSIYHIGNFLYQSKLLYDEEGIAFILRREKKNIILERWDMRASEILGKVWGLFKGDVFISGTLEPVDAFSDVVGLKSYRYLKIPHDVEENNIKSMIINGVSTRGERIPSDMVLRYSRILNSFLERFSDLNVAIFSASYRVQETLIEIVDKKFWPRLFIEREGMAGDESREILDKFKRSAYSDKKGILFATAFGRFAEGADFPGKELEAVLIAGIPFEKMNIKVETYIEYYNKKFGEKKGRYYAYVVPALRRASQAMGRVIRSSKDKGIFILADERYLRKEYFQLLPDFIKISYTIANLDDFQKKMDEFKKIFQ